MKKRRNVFGVIAITLFLMGPLNVFAQARQITGTVSDATQTPIVGAVVSVESNPSATTITGADGNFTLMAQTGDVIQVAFLGYLPKSVEVTSLNVYPITMEVGTQVIDEVIVTGYGAVSRKNLTTAISKVSGDDVQKTAVSNMSQMLMGRAAGLQATVSSMQPGGNVNISIRGGGAPLYVVDGMVMPGNSLEGGSGGTTTVMPDAIDRSGLAGLNPEDVESIEILKDASASIYGIGANNGVILITTKRGKQGRISTTYDGSVSLVKNYPYLEMLDAQGFMNYSNIFAKEVYLFNNKQGVYGPDPYDGGFINPYTPEQIASAKTTDWQGMILRNGSVHKHNVTVQGGSSQLSYYLSGNFYDQIGSVASTRFQRYTLRGNVGAQLTDFLKLTTSFNVNNNRAENGSVGGSSNGRGTQASGSLAAAMVYPTYLPLYDENGDYTLQPGGVPNGVAMQDIQDESKFTGYNLNFVADVSLIKNVLTAKFSYGHNNENSQRSVYIPSDVYYDFMFRSRGSLSRDDRTNTTMEGLINFNKAFANNNVRVDATIGMGHYVNKVTGMSVAYTDTKDAIANDNISAATGIFAPNSYRAEGERRSQFARASIDLFDRYVVAGTLRRDGFDKFFPGKKYNLFPSVSVAWKIMNESFVRDISWIKLLKARFSYGVTGNDELANSTNLYANYIPHNTIVMFDHNQTKYTPFYSGSMDYPNVSWERTIMKNVGLDFSFFTNDRLSGSIDIFWNDITRRLGTANSEALSMYPQIPINGGHIRRQGWDATFNTKNIIGPKFNWSSVLTFSRYNAIWKTRMPNHDFREYQMRENEPMNATYFYRTAGIINADGSNIPDSQPETHRYPGMAIIKDLDGDGEITIEDIDMVNQIPKIYFGFGNTFTYKNWDLDIFVYSQLGLSKNNYSYSWAGTGGLANQTSNSSVFVRDIWTSVNPNGTRPGIANGQVNTPLPGSAGTDLNYQDASFLRVRNITLGYSLDREHLGKMGQFIGSLRVYLDAQNPFLLTSFEGFDPEVRTGGGYKSGNAEYPMTRTFSVGLRLSF